MPDDKKSPLTVAPTVKEEPPKKEEKKISDEEVKTATEVARDDNLVWGTRLKELQDSQGKILKEHGNQESNIPYNHPEYWSNRNELAVLLRKRQEEASRK